MRRFYPIIRSIVSGCLMLLLSVPVAIYVLTALPSVQQRLRAEALTVLAEQLPGVRIEIGDLTYTPFNRLTLRRVVLCDSAGVDTMATIRNLSTGVSIADWLRHRRVTVSYASLLGADIRLHRDSAGAPLNIQPLIDAVGNRKTDTTHTSVNVRINAVVIRRSSVRFDDKSIAATPGRFNPGHIMLTDVAADLRLPQITDNAVDVELRRLALNEGSGFHLQELSASVRYTPGALYINRLAMELPHSRLWFADPDTVPLPLDIRHTPVDIRLRAEITPADLQSFYPPLALLHESVGLNLDVSGIPDSLCVNNLNIESRSPYVSLDAQGSIFDMLPDSDKISRPALDLTVMTVNADPLQLSQTVMQVSGKQLPDKIIDVFESIGLVNLEVSGYAAQDTLSANVDLAADSIAVEMAATAVRDNGDVRLTADCRVMASELTPLLSALGMGNGVRIGETILSGATDLTLRNDGLPYGHTDLNIDLLTVDGNILEDIELAASLEANGELFADVKSANDGLSMNFTADGDLSADNRQLSYILRLQDLNPALAGIRLPERFDDFKLSLESYGRAAITPANNSNPVGDIIGSMTVGNIVWRQPGGDQVVNIGKITIDSRPGHIRLSADPADMTLTGNFDVAHLESICRRVVDAVTVALTGNAADISEPLPELALTLSIKNSELFEQLFKMPVAIRYPVTLKARIDGAADTLGLALDAPYLWQGKKEINRTYLTFSLRGLSTSAPSGRLTASTIVPTKKGPATIGINSSLNISENIPNMSLGATWKIEADRDFSGQIKLSLQSCDTLLNKRNMPEAWRLKIDPGHMTFNDTVWHIRPAVVNYTTGKLSVDDFKVGHGDQFVAVDGSLSASDPKENLRLKLSNVDLDYVFETLGIENAMFGGRASGLFTASGLLAGQPDVRTDDLFVQGLKYNFSVLGDTHIKASLIPDGPAVSLQGRIDQSNGCHSLIGGSILATSEGYLDLRFDADRVPVGFMRPFMAAFANNVTGNASGKVHLFGTFKDVNMSGDVLAHNLGLQLDFTGTTVYAPGDSVHIRPGIIPLENIHVSDGRGGTARLDGWLRHTNFHKPEFEFNISQANDMLVYNMQEDPSRRWFGTIYGNGGANVTGVPGKIGIKVDMSTAPGSSFTFIISDAEEAYDYDFITYRDIGPKTAPALNPDAPPQSVADMRRAIADKAEEQSDPTAYDIGINVRVDPSARLTVVMDPAGGDAIRARGNGVLALDYRSAGEELELRGDYTLTEGTYNFTFQDIIRKDFKIREGSMIRFAGDPYAARLDLAAAYRVTANLSDLDESFLSMPELTRTTVPTDAMLYVKGDMRSPEIEYDFEFPTLKDDVKRKVNSIVSTEDMRARQMLYLLALSRFYTPDYVSATRGNELFSVASSTLSSQIGNMLGSLANGWTIAPNIRSDRGDFSDVEVDLALSSSLLNNRLLFNGNFGYRDKTLNNNTFIGDFDLEYLLNRGGSLRLKAYNRYNDQNFYVRNALTTQGVGLVYRRDFDNILSFWHDLRRKKQTRKTVAAPALPNDSVNVTLQ